MLTFKSLRNLAPTYISELHTFSFPAFIFCWSSEHSHIKPQHHGCTHTYDSLKPLQHSDPTSKLTCSNWNTHCNVQFTVHFTVLLFCSPLPHTSIHFMFGFVLSVPWFAVLNNVNNVLLHCKVSVGERRLQIKCIVIIIIIFYNRLYIDCDRPSYNTRKKENTFHLSNTWTKCWFEFYYMFVLFWPTLLFI